jgi:hypothetical protein
MKKNELRLFNTKCLNLEPGTRFGVGKMLLLVGLLKFVDEETSANLEMSMFFTQGSIDYTKFESVLFCNLNPDPEPQLELN